jgi:D-ribose pyranose/furanose isomerase RbsD
MAEIQKSMKTMGKAMTQLGEGADFDKDLFKEQSHERVCTQAKPLYTPVMTGKMYSFATTILGARMLGDKAFE